MKSSRSSNSLPTSWVDGSFETNDQTKIGNIFNSFFTSLSSNSLKSNDESSNYVYVKNTFEKLSRENKFTLPQNGFSFSKTTCSIVEKLINNLDSSSSPGVSGIPVKILKFLGPKLAPILTVLFNFCIETNRIPLEWKEAVVTPLVKKKKLSLFDLNNYRGISVLPPVAKIFEKILASQITIYMNMNKMLFSGQHGFRSGHSCETALHELLSDINTIRDKRSIALLLFIDFRKAFDLVDSDLLIKKLFFYGFDNNSLGLIQNYFAGRKQVVKYNKTFSLKEDITLGVPQGSILGPLFFLIMINDLPFILELSCKLFADDTTLYDESDNINFLVRKFIIKIQPMIEWCSFNKLDINWSKTFFMIITNQMKKLFPTEILIGDIAVQVVDKFKLLGVTIDNKLNFDKYSSDLRKSINFKLYSIKRIFFLAHSVKIQFFKTFILPYFDYCLSLLIYFPKSTVQKISNCYNMCLLKLFKFKLENSTTIKNDELNDSCVNNNRDLFLYNEKLEKYGIQSFQHRFLKKIFNFTYKLINAEVSPVLLRNIVLNADKSVARTLRGGKVVSDLETGRAACSTFTFFFTRLLNNFSFINFYQQFSSFKYFINCDLELIFNTFMFLFPKFDLNYNTYVHFKQKKKKKIIVNIVNI